MIFTKRNGKFNIELFGNEYYEVKEAELASVYGGCNLDYSPIAMITENVIINDTLR